MTDFSDHHIAPPLSSFPVPLLGFAAWSGTGKTTLLAKLIPLLNFEGVKVALVKHAHHGFDIDHSNKDSYTLREAGACQVVVASAHLIAAMYATPNRKDEPDLQEALETVQPERLDLVLVEGFKKAEIPKIELHREALNKPYLYPDDTHIIALADDSPMTSEGNADAREITHLDLNQPEQITTFIMGWLATKASS